MAKILIIDDDVDIAVSTRIILESKNHTVIHSLSGEDGIAKTREEKPDLIILDVMMPDGMDGFDVARKLKQEDSAKNIPILMLTSIKDQLGLDFKNTAGDQDWLPVDAYCEKPLKHQELIETIDKLLDS